MHVLVIITQHIRSEVKSSNDNKIKWNERSKKGIKEEIGGKGRKKNNLIIKYFNNSQGVRLNINNMTRNEKLTFTIYGLFVGINDDYCLFIIYCFLSSVIHHWNVDSYWLWILCVFRCVNFYKMNENIFFNLCFYAVCRYINLAQINIGYNSVLFVQVLWFFFQWYIFIFSR